MLSINHRYIKKAALFLGIFLLFYQLKMNYNQTIYKKQFDSDLLVASQDIEKKAFFSRSPSEHLVMFFAPSNMKKAELGDMIVVQNQDEKLVFALAKTNSKFPPEIIIDKKVGDTFVVEQIEYRIIDIMK